jgi:hypothetical protein
MRRAGSTRGPAPARRRNGPYESDRARLRYFSLMLTVFGEVEAIRPG